jgi:hypothetical protein
MNQNLRQFMNIINETIEPTKKLNEGYFKDMDMELEGVVQEAENAFWAVVANWAKTTHPELELGDLTSRGNWPPENEDLQSAMMSAVSMWISDESNEHSRYESEREFND